MCSCPSEIPFECDCYQSDDGCVQRWGCIKQLMVCNGRYDCSDKSDEEMCVCPSDRPFDCDCHQSDDGCSWRFGCLETSRLCDGVYDCPDKDDEEMCDCPSNRPFECHCYQSDGGCAQEWFTRWGCIRQSEVCDGVYDCADSSDEVMCDCPSNRPFECDSYRSGDGLSETWLLHWGCVRQLEVCDGDYNCLDNSDEEMWDCPSNTFECDCYQSDDGCAGTSGRIARRGKGCYEQLFVCNGENDCGDWSDEKYCLNTKLYCRYDECIERSKVNDGEVDMTGGYDEFICCATQGHKCGCIPGNGNCTSSGKCIPMIWNGDARNDCSTNHSDEPCKAIKHWRENCQVVINRCSTNESKMFLLQNSNKNTTTCHLNNSSFHHLNLSMEWMCISSLWGNCLGEIFQCENGHVIDNAHYCDTKMQCQDGSDEQQPSIGFRCSGKSRKSTCVLPQKNLYDSTSQCADGSDICFEDGEFRCFLCLDEKLIISAKQVCDRIIDCFDGSDELLCSNQSVAQALVGDEGSRCPPGHMHCNCSTGCVAMDKVLCNFSVECKEKVNHRFCRHEQRFNGYVHCLAEHATKDKPIPVIATLCDN